MGPGTLVVTAIMITVPVLVGACFLWSSSDGAREGSDGARLQSTNRKKKKKKKEKLDDRDCGDRDADPYAGSDSIHRRFLSPQVSDSD